MAYKLISFKNIEILAPHAFVLVLQCMCFIYEVIYFVTLFLFVFYLFVFSFNGFYRLAVVSNIRFIDKTFT